jgi:hypothetical protein
MFLVALGWCPVPTADAGGKKLFIAKLGLFVLNVEANSTKDS